MQCLYLWIEKICILLKKKKKVNYFHCKGYDGNHFQVISTNYFSFFVYVLTHGAFWIILKMFFSGLCLMNSNVPDEAALNVSEAAWQHCFLASLCYWGLHIQPPTKDSTQAHWRRLLHTSTLSHTVYIRRRLLGLQALVACVCTGHPSFLLVSLAAVLVLLSNLSGLIQCHKLLCFLFLLFL